MALAGPDAQWRPLDLDLHHRLQVHRSLGFVRGIAQTPDGYLWFGTSFGVARYDGVSFDFFDRSNTPAFQDDHIMGLTLAQEGGLWIASQRAGLIRYEQGRFHHIPMADAFAEAEISAMAQDDQGALWVGTVLSGLHSFKNAQWRHWPEAGGRVSRIVKARDNVLLFQTDVGWFRVHAGNLAQVPKEEFGQDQASEATFLLQQILPKNAAPLQAAVFDEVRGRYFQSSHVTSDGVIWLGMNGLTRIAADNRRVFKVTEGVASDNVLSIFEDREGNVWSGHHGTGLTQMSRIPFFSFTVHSGFGGGAAFSLAETQDGTVWISHSSGLTQVKDGAFRNWWPSKDLPLWGVRSLAVDADGALWMILADHSLARLVNERMTVYPLPRQAERRFATALAIAPDGTLWTAPGEGGLLRFDGRSFEEVPLPQIGEPGCRASISIEYPCPQAVNVIQPAKAGGLWLGTTKRGLWRYTPDGQTTQLPGKLLAQAMVFSIKETEGNALWVGTDRGLFFVAPGRTTLLSRKEGLASEGVFSILDDGEGRLWIGSERGVYNLRTSELEAVVNGRATAVDPVSYRALDGLPSDEMIRRFEPSAIQSQDGRLWFAAVAGVAVFQPPRQLRRPPAPEARLERVVLKHNEFRAPWPDGSVKVPPGTGDLEFHYTAPAFGAPHRIRFAYKLDGFDKAWINADGRRSAYYTNIPAGAYRFRVKADSANTGPAASEATFAFVLRPHFYETVWFYLLVAASLVVVVLSFQRWRMSHVKSKFAAVLDERNRIARDLHDTLAQVFSAIGFQVDSAMGVAPQDSPLLKERLKRLRQMLAHARLAARNVIWNLRQGDQESSSVQSLVAKLEAIAPVYDAARVVVTTSGPPRALPASIENELFHIAQEAVSNAVEHGKAELISLELEVLGSRLDLLIHDNGKGFVTSPSASTPQFGLRGMRERAQRIGAELHMHTEPEVGTEISVSVPLETPV